MKWVWLIIEFDHVYKLLNFVIMMRDLMREDLSIRSIVE